MTEYTQVGVCSLAVRFVPIPGGNPAWSCMEMQASVSSVGSAPTRRPSNRKGCSDASYHRDRLYQKARTIRMTTSHEALRNRRIGGCGARGRVADLRKERATRFPVSRA